MSRFHGRIGVQGTPEIPGSYGTIYGQDLGASVMMNVEGNGGGPKDAVYISLTSGASNNLPSVLIGRFTKADLEGGLPHVRLIKRLMAVLEECQEALDPDWRGDSKVAIKAANFYLLRGYLPKEF